MKISVLVCTYNRKAALQRTLDALLAQDYPAQELDLIISDDAGSDDTPAAVAAREKEFLTKGYRSFRFVRQAENRGISFGRRYVTEQRAPDAEAVLYLDDDVVMEKGTLTGLVACLRGDKDSGAAGPRLVYASAPSRTAHCANFVGPWSGLYTEADPDVTTECDWLNSTCLLVRTVCLTKAAWEGTEFITAHEEVDFCLRLKALGWKLLYCPSVKAAHDIAVDLPCRRDRLYYIYRNKLLVFRRNFPPLRRLTAFSVSVFFGLPKYMLESVRFNGGFNWRELKSIFRALADGLAGRGGVYR